ncbi:MAG: type II secretion system major pseudopilin GspG [Phycisphaeraceae bacterium]|nr:type II secretion system major pseudopilin GspG [Phycisphaeraceae bacterium]
MNSKLARRRSGFTLIEVLIVIAIILTLTGLVGVALFQRRDEAKVDLTKTDMNTIKSAMKQFYMHFERYPTTDEGIAVLWDKTRLEDPELEDKWGGYLEKKLETDKWGHEWGYEQMAYNAYKIWSVGPDGEEETDDDLKDGYAPPGSEDSDTMMMGDDLLPPAGGG